MNEFVSLCFLLDQCCAKTERLWVQFFLITYLSFCHRTASDSKYWTVRALVMTLTTSYLKKSLPALGFLENQCSWRFLGILLH